MSTGSPHLGYRRLRAPKEDRGALVDPPFERVGGLFQTNQRLRRGYDYDLHGRSLAEVSRQARGELLDEARQWTGQYRDTDFGQVDPSAPIFLAGHQPQLFHPGVWFKSFVLAELARRHGAIAVNLLIDSDTLKRPELRVPGGSADRPQVAQIPMDDAGPIVPYEERRILNRETFADFGRRAAEQIAPLVPDPLVSQYWPLAVERMRQSDNLGACLAQSRHQLEGRWGCSTLEIPQSRVCRARAHGWFVAHLLAELPRLRAVYNEVVEQYRRIHRIRSRAHPVPNLAREDEWLEAPFWVWTRADPRRRRLFVRSGRGEIVLSDRGSLETRLPLTVDGDAAGAVDRLGELEREGVKLRCRALMTTLWARLVLGDLFVHGIGGAKYDQVTDALAARFFGLQPPSFLVVSATLHLPVARRRATADDLRAIEQGLRELTYHPECYINGLEGPGDRHDAEAAKLIDAKKAWIRTPSTPDNARARFEQIRRINEALQRYVEPHRARLLAQRRQTARAVGAEAILSGREFGFCLFPGKTLRDFFVSLLPKSVEIVSDSR
jgi:hypothetical protein